MESWNKLLLWPQGIPSGFPSLETLFGQSRINRKSLELYKRLALLIGMHTLAVMFSISYSLYFSCILGLVAIPPPTAAAYCAVLVCLIVSLPVRFVVFPWLVSCLWTGVFWASAGAAGGFSRCPRGLWSLMAGTSAVPSGCSYCGCVRLLL